MKSSSIELYLTLKMICFEFEVYRKNKASEVLFLIYFKNSKISKKLNILLQFEV